MFIYEGISSTGEKVSGKFAGSKQELVEYLKSENIILISIKEDTSKPKKDNISLEKIYSNLEQINYLLSAGMKIDKAIYTLIKNLNEPSLIEFWEITLKYLKEGKQFSTALKEASSMKNLSIPEFYINIISVGESVGDIKPSLKAVLEDITFKQNLKKEIRSSLSYPLFLIIMSFITILIVSIFILPKFSQIFTQEEMEKLPFLSRFVLNTGLFIKENVTVILFLLILLVTLTFSIFQNHRAKKVILNILSKVPYINKILIPLEMSNIFSSLSIMLKGGLHLNKAIHLTKGVARLDSTKNILEELQIEIKKGKKLSQVLRKYPFIPYDIIALISVGEDSGKIDEVLEKLSKKYIENFREKIASLLTLLEPTVIVTVGIFIGLIVISILLAVLSISDVF